MKFPIVKFKSKSKTQIKGLECLNCRQPLTGNENFCSYCGQKNTTKKLSFSVFINNVFNGFFSYDSRFWTTFIPLLTKPGKVSKDYVQGKRARFVNPFQLYLNVSIIFFLILGISNRVDSLAIPVDEISNANETIDSLKQTNQQQIDSIVESAKNEIEKTSPNDTIATKVLTDLGGVFRLTETLDSIQDEKPYQYHIKTDTTKRIGILNRIEDFQHYYKKNPTYSAVASLDSLGYEKTFWNSFYYQQIVNSNKNYDQMKADGGRQYINKIFSYISISLFIFLPIFTLFLMLIYIRRKFTYIEHLVFVFNTQTVFFLLLSIFFLIGLAVDMENVAWVFMLIFLIYLYKALRNFYQQSRTKTIIKLILLNSFYMFLAFIGITIVAAISFVST